LFVPHQLEPPLASLKFHIFFSVIDETASVNNSIHLLYISLFSLKLGRLRSSLWVPSKNEEERTKGEGEGEWEEEEEYSWLFIAFIRTKFV
jgi:hypothetical protein